MKQDALVGAGSARSTPKPVRPGAGVLAIIAGTVAVVGALAPVVAQERFIPPQERRTAPGAESPPATPRIEPAPEAAVPVPSAPADPSEPVKADPEVDGWSAPVSAFVLTYFRDLEVEFPAGMPTEEALLSARVRLGRTSEGFVAPRAGVPTVEATIAELNAMGSQVYYASAIKKVSDAVVREFSSRGIIGVTVNRLRSEIDEGEDNRGGRTELTLAIIVGVVDGVRSLATGERLGDPRVNNPAHAWIRASSPVQPGQALNRDRLDEYALRLSRHPGRRVDVAVAPGEKRGGITLDYLVLENKPWSVYGQLSNTGTRETDEWRQRFGFVHNQLTGNDDILRFDYVTAGFAQSHAFVGSYEFPVCEHARVRVFGQWNRFTASDVGILNETFKGETWNAGGEIIGRFLQWGNLFVDPYVGVRFERTRVNNSLVNVTGDHGFFIPVAGVRVERPGDVFSLAGSVSAEWNVAEVGGSNFTELQNLGRFNPDISFTIIRADVEASFFLEPLLFPNAFRGQGLGPTDPGGVPWQPGMTLANEIWLSARGQYSPDRRLVPSLLATGGGLFTVRGYPESFTAGDSAVFLTAEYRLHIPRIFRPVLPENPEDFRWVPSESYGSADWDLIFRSFIDAGRVVNNDRQFFEFNQTLLGAGIGLELQVKRNFNARLDWGIALRETNGTGRRIERGDNRLHFIMTLLF